MSIVSPGVRDRGISRIPANYIIESFESQQIVFRYKIRHSKRPSFFRDATKQASNIKQCTDAYDARFVITLLDQRSKIVPSTLNSMFVNLHDRSSSILSTGTSCTRLSLLSLIVESLTLPSLSSRATSPYRFTANESIGLPPSQFVDGD